MKEKTKILYCITKSNWGGAQKYVFNLATLISKDYFDAVVVCGGNGELKNRLIEKGTKVITVESLARDVSFSKDFLTLRELVKIFKDENPKVVHLNSSKMGMLGALAVFQINFKRKISNFIFRNKEQIIKTVFTAHGWAFNEDRPFWQKSILKFLHKRTISLCDKTIAVADVIRNQIVNEKNKDKIITIYNGIENIKYKTKKLSKEEIGQKANKIFTPKTKWLGTISELHKNKGLEYAIEAFSNLRETTAGKNCKFFIIGEGEERKTLENKIVNLKLENEIFLLGHIQGASMMLKAFDIFILSSITEALPYVLLEAGQASLPIIASRVGGIPEIIDDEINGLLSRSKDSKEISSIIEYLLNNKEIAKKFGVSIKEKILKNFSIKECLEKTARLYGEIIE